MRTDPRDACKNERQRLLWAIVHDGLAHPLMVLTGYCKAALRFHDWTSHRAWPRTPVKRKPGIVYRMLDYHHVQAVERELRRRKCPFCTTAEPHYHDDGKIFYIYQVEELQCLTDKNH